MELSAEDIISRLPSDVLNSGHGTIEAADFNTVPVSLSPNSIKILSRIMSAAWNGDLTVAPMGGGTLASIGNEIAGTHLRIGLSRLNRIIDYNPSDLTITVEAGITFAQLQKTLRQKGQFLAIDPPIPERATVGGTLATGISGPLKWQYGNPRDTVIGMKIVQPDGTITKSGGRVVKNVSGYDMTRLHIGGLGTLGIITEVSFKLTPLPREESTIVAVFASSQDCLDCGHQIFESDVIPLAMVSLNGTAIRSCDMKFADKKDALFIRLGGRPQTLRRQEKEIRSLCNAAGALNIASLSEESTMRSWRRIADFGWDNATCPIASVKITCPPANMVDLKAKIDLLCKPPNMELAIIGHPGYGSTIISLFNLGDTYDNATITEVASHLREMCKQVDGQMTIQKLPTQLKHRLDVWNDVGSSLLIMRELKRQYDPKGILNPGRFVGGI